MPVAVRPPCVYTSHPDAAASERRASTATTTHCEPKCSAARRTSSGSESAAVFTATLSAPAPRMALKSSTERMPPPTVKGMNTESAVRRMTSSIDFRPSWLAVMSRKQSSSARSAS